MTIDILPATESDVSALTIVGLQAFANDPLNKALEKVAELNPIERSEHLQWRTQYNLRRMTGPGKFWFKAFDSATGDLVGYVGMVAPAKTRPEAPKIDESRAEVPTNVDVGLLGIFECKCEEMRKRHMGDRDDHWFVSSMTVHPDYQGQGIAKRLLLKGLELADEAGQDVYLESTPSGKELYQRMGFEVLEEFTVRNTFPMTVMLRRAKTQS